jgi:hypothetical protein
MLESGVVKSLWKLARREGVLSSYVSRMINVTTLAPDIVAAILDEALSPEVTLFDLAVDPPALLGGSGGRSIHKLEPIARTGEKSLGHIRIIVVCLQNNLKFRNSP